MSIISKANAKSGATEAKWNADMLDASKIGYQKGAQKAIDAIGFEMAAKQSGGLAEYNMPQAYIEANYADPEGKYNGFISHDVGTRYRKKLYDPKLAQTSAGGSIVTDAGTFTGELVGSPDGLAGSKLGYEYGNNGGYGLYGSATANIDPHEARNNNYKGAVGYRF